MRAAGWRRVLQLALACLWLTDGVLQFQGFMFGDGFGRMVTQTARGSPAIVAGPVAWTGHLIAQWPLAATVVIGVAQMLLGVGIAWRLTTRLALAASVLWSLGVWWLGEGFGGLFAPAASPVTGAPGAVILYALLAVVLWPSARDAGAGPAAVAARAIGARTAWAAWIVLWGGMAALCLLPGAVNLPLAAVLALIAAGAVLPARWRMATLVLAVVLAFAWWTSGQAYGDLLTGTATDLNSGPLLILLAAAYWPVRGTRVPGSRVPGEPAYGEPAAQRASGSRRDAVRPARWLAWPAAHDTDVMTGVMGAGMAAMLLPGLDPLPGLAWTVIFAGAAGWFCWRAVSSWRSGLLVPDHATHLLSCGGMLVMLIAPHIGAGMSVAGAGAAGAMGGSGNAGAALWPALAGVFAVAIAAAVVVAVDRLSGVLTIRAGGTPRGSAGRCLRGSCQVAMGLAMACLLVQLL